MTSAPSDVRASDDLLSEARAIFPAQSFGSYAVPPWLKETIIDHASGSRMVSRDGRSYLDYILGSGPLILGHAHPRVVAAVQAQVARGSTFYALNAPVIELGERITAAVPCAEQILFASSGAEATYLALRLARAATGREKILRFAGGYHGHHDYASTDSAGVPRVVAETVLLAPFNDLAAVEQLFAAHSGTIAAVLVEPLHRITPPAEGFLTGLRDLAHREGALLIFDEVVTGFRLAWGGAQERYGVTPDLACYGKIIGGGYPVSAVCGARSTMEQLDRGRAGPAGSVFFSGTLSGNPIGATAGLATLEVLSEPGSYERLNQAGAALRSGFTTAAQEVGLPLSMEGEGAVSGVVLTPSGELSEEERATLLARLGRALFERGVLSNLGKVYVSLAHTDEDLQATIRAFFEALTEVKRGLGGRATGTSL